MRWLTLAVILLKVTLVPTDSRLPNRTYYCSDARVFPRIGYFSCIPPALDVIWVDLSERDDQVVIEAVKDDLF